MIFIFEQNSTSEADFLRYHFAKYYSKNFVDSVPNPEFREFGFGVYKRKIANRNMGFSSHTQINSFLRESAPLFFSYSNAYYKFPSRTPTLAKEFIKADLIYEFDADELGLDVPVINDVQWFASEHLELAKKQVFRLMDFLHNDFGFSDDGVAINFSGKAGFHVHLRGENVQNLNRRARIELVDYLTTNSVDFANLGFDFVALRVPQNKGLWGKRLIEGAKKVLQKDAKELGKLTSVSAKKVSEVLVNRDALFASLDSGRLMPMGRKSKDFWSAIFDLAVEKEAVPIDRQTSVDLNKIIRVPNTLHGDTGFLAKVIPIDKLAEFDPFKDSIVFGSEQIKLHVLKAPKFSLKGESFGPFENIAVELPLFAAIFLIGKGAATLIK